MPRNPVENAWSASACRSGMEVSERVSQTRVPFWGSSMIVVREMELCLSIDDVLDRPLWQGPAARSRDFLETTRSVLDTVQARGLIRGRCVTGIFPVRWCTDRSIMIQSGKCMEISLPDETRRLASHLGFSIATIGPGCEEWATQSVRSGDRLHGLLVDAVGSTAVELLADRCRNLVGEMASRLRLRMGPTIRPGDAGCVLRQQSRIHGLLHGEQIGVNVSSSGMLHPVKSLSCVVPLGPNMPCCSGDHTCSRCRMSDTCMFRRHVRS